MKIKLPTSLLKKTLLTLASVSFILIASPSSGGLESGADEAGWIYQQAEAKFAAKSYPEASSLYRQLLLKGEGEQHRWASFKLALSYEKMGDYHRSIQTYQTVLKQYPHLADYSLYRIGVSFMGLGDHPKAIEIFHRLISIHGNNTTLIPYSYEKMAESYRQLEQYPPALEAYGKVVDINPTFFDIPEIRMKIAGLYEEISRWKEAVNVYHEVIESHPKEAAALAAINRMDELIAAHPEIDYSPNPDEVYKRSYALYLNSHYQDAVVGFSKAIKEGKVLPSLYWRARAYLAQRKYSKAIDDFTRVNDLHPGNPTEENAKYYLALTYERKGDYDKALSSYEELVRRYPSGRWAVGVLMKRAAYYEGRSRFESAIGEYQRVCLDYGRSASASEACFRVAIIQYRMGRHKEAAAALEKTLTRFPDSRSSGSIGYWAGKTYHKLGNTSKALEFYRRVIIDYPYDYYAFRAREQLAELDPLYPFEADRLYQQGIETYNEGHYGEAAETFYQMILLHPDGDYDKEKIAEKIKAAAELAVGHKGDPRDSTYFRLFSLNGKEMDLPNSYSREHYRKGNDLIAMGLHADGLREMRVALSYRSDDVRELYELSLAHYQGGKYRNSINIASHILSRIFGKRYILIYPQEVSQLLYPLPYRELVDDNSRRHGLDFYLMNALIREESRFDSEDVSWVGAVGLMQIMPSTGRWIAEKIDLNSYRPETLFNPESNIRLGSWYMAYLLRLFDEDLTLALASYNAGPGSVQRWLKKNKMTDSDTFIEFFPFRETRWFIKKVYRSYANYRYFSGER